MFAGPNLAPPLLPLVLTSVRLGRLRLSVHPAVLRDGTQIKRQTQIAPRASPPHAPGRSLGTHAHSGAPDPEPQRTPWNSSDCGALGARAARAGSASAAGSVPSGLRGLLEVLPGSLARGLRALGCEVTSVSSLSTPSTSDRSSPHSAGRKNRKRRCKGAWGLPLLEGEGHRRRAKASSEAGTYPRPMWRCGVGRILIISLGKRGS